MNNNTVQRYHTQDLDTLNWNDLDLLLASYHDDIEGLIDETLGGIIAYGHMDNIRSIMRMLNKYQQAIQWLEYIVSCGYLLQSSEVNGEIRDFLNSINHEQETTDREQLRGSKDEVL